MAIRNIVGQAPQKKQIFQIAIRDTGKGSFCIYAVDENGRVIKNGDLIKIGKATGSVYFHKDINSALGLKLTREGRLCVKQPKMNVKTHRCTRA
jgi:hypothetical protein